MAELYKILVNRKEKKSYLFLYTDGGSDHRVTYVCIH